MSAEDRQLRRANLEQVRVVVTRRLAELEMTGGEARQLEQAVLREFRRHWRLRQQPVDPCRLVDTVYDVSCNGDPIGREWFDLDQR